MAPQLQTQAETTAAYDWNPACHITYTRDTWVQLVDAPSAYAADAAQLLCQESPDYWVTWVPDHGEVVLHRGQFYV